MSEFLERIYFRTWWQVPRKAGDRNDQRKVSFLELFYDLVYVVLVSEIAHAFAAHLDLKHLAQFVFLFGIVWWAWLNGTTYYEYHGNNDIRTRVLTLLQMIAVAGMAVFAHGALGEGSTGFAISYGFFQIVLCYMWWRLATHDPEHHLENRSFVIFFSISTALFFLSILFPAPYRFYIWALAVFLSLAQPFIMFILRPRAQVQRSELHISPALIERFGLFNILVLAEIIVGVVSGLGGSHHVGLHALATGALGMGVAFCMWWLYFDSIAHRHPKKGQANGAVWFYMHLFVSMSIVATGAAMLNVVQHANATTGHVVEHVGEPITDVAAHTNTAEHSVAEETSPSEEATSAQESTQGTEHENTEHQNTEHEDIATEHEAKNVGHTNASETEHTAAAHVTESSANEPLDKVVRWILVGSIEVYFLTLIMLMQVIEVADHLQNGYRTMAILICISALIIGLLGLSNFSVLTVLSCIILLMITPIIYAIIYWVKTYHAKQVAQANESA